MPPIRHIVLPVIVGIGGTVALPSPAGQVFEVVAKNYQFTPENVEIKVGDTVRWFNREKRTSHSIFFTGENSLESDRIFPGESWERVFTKPGIHAYTCGPHPEMTGRITVTE